MRRWHWIFVTLAAVAVGIYYYYEHYAAGRESTDDAQIDGHIHPVAAQVGGVAVKVMVKNNQAVQVGDVLLEVDPQYYRVAVERAKADLAEAQANLSGNRVEVPIVTTTTTSQVSSATAGVVEARASISTAEKQVDAAQARLRSLSALIREAKANADRTARDLERMKMLVAKEEISKQQYDASVSAAEVSKAQVDATEAQLHEAEQAVRVAESQLGQYRARLTRAESDARATQTGPQQVAVSRARAESSSAKVQQMKAALEKAELDLVNTIVKAPITGVIAQKSVETGQVVQPGQPLLAVVALDDVWVTANFKENQLAQMRPGQPVKIAVDAYGGRIYDGHVDSISAATGARFSMLPAENATGNFVKVVQRVPVKVVFEKGQDAEHTLRPGMSVIPSVFIK